MVSKYGSRRIISKGRKKRGVTAKAFGNLQKAKNSIQPSRNKERTLLARKNKNRLVQHQLFETASDSTSQDAGTQEKHSDLDSSSAYESSFIDDDVDGNEMIDVHEDDEEKLPGINDSSEMKSTTKRLGAVFRGKNKQKSSLLRRYGKKFFNTSNNASIVLGESEELYPIPDIAEETFEEQEGLLSQERPIDDSEEVDFHGDIETQPGQQTRSTSNASSVVSDDERDDDKNIDSRQMEHSDSENNILQQALQLQDNLVSKKKKRLQKIRLDTNPLSSGMGDERNVLDFRQQWHQDIAVMLRDNPSFLTSDEARMVHSVERKTGTPMYRKLPINEKNSHDMNKMYKVLYETKNRHGYGTAVYSQFLTTIGQYARMCVAMQSRDYNREDMLEDICEEGQLFILATKFQMIELFVKFFDGRSNTSATALTKCIHLLKFVEHSINFFMGGGDQERLKHIYVVRDYLRSNRSAFKKFTREAARRKKKLRVDQGSNQILQPRHFKDCRSTALKKLSNIMSSIRIIQSEKSKKEAVLCIRKNVTLITKWCINFLGLMMISCGGQRPQVFIQLQRPDRKRLTAKSSTTVAKHYIELETIQEKTVRALDMPFVPCPKDVGSIIGFHVEEILPILDYYRSKNVRISKEESDFASKCLILNSRTGVRLKTQQITRSFHAFVSPICPDLTHVTSMSLRASFATMMLHGFRKKLVFVGETEAMFLEYLGKAMNTSPEQLTTTYASTLGKDYSDIAHQIAEGMMQVMQNVPSYDSDSGTSMTLGDQERCDLEDHKEFYSMW